MSEAGKGSSSGSQRLVPQQFMAQALQLAEQGLYTTDPNPRVGCLVVKDGQVVGRGWHRRAGEPHAEVHALQEAGEQARGATLYVTLEPCSHHGRTPPCAEAVLRSGVRRVVVAMRDPNPQVAGRGLEMLRQAGIEVEVGVLEKQARELNIGFVSRMERGRPWVRCKLAMSLDGRTAMASGESFWITGPAARQDVQRLRARSSAVITGVGTLLHDNPSMNVRAAELGKPSLDESQIRQPLRVVVDSGLRGRPDAKLFGLEGDTLVAYGPSRVAADAVQEFQARGITLLPLDENEAGLDLAQLLKELAARGCNEVLVEAGAGLSGAFMRAGLIDELWVYMAPKLMGSSARPLLDLPEVTTMAESVPLELQDVRQVGQDLRLIYSPPAPAKANL